MFATEITWTSNAKESMKTIDDLQADMYSIASQLNAPLSEYEREITIPTKDPKPSWGAWYEMGDNGQYLCISTDERTYERNLRVFENEDELLYSLTDSLITDMAQRWELERRQPGVDSRRMWFARKIELFGYINHRWQQRASEEIKATLSRSPYRDV